MLTTIPMSERERSLTGGAGVPIVLLHLDLRGHGPAGDLSEEHVHGASYPPCPSRRAGGSRGDVALLRGRAKWLAVDPPEAEADHPREDRLHLRRIEAGGHGQKLATVRDDRRVVRIHARDRGDAQRRATRQVRAQPRP